MTSIFLVKLIASGLVFAVLFLILAMTTSELDYDRCSDFLYALSGWSLLFLALCTVVFVLFQIWGT